MSAAVQLCVRGYQQSVPLIVSALLSQVRRQVLSSSRANRASNCYTVSNCSAEAAAPAFLCMDRLVLLVTLDACHHEECAGNRFWQYAHPFRVSHMASIAGPWCPSYERAASVASPCAANSSSIAYAHNHTIADVLISWAGGSSMGHVPDKTHSNDVPFVLT